MKKNKGGRPSSYDPKYCQEIVDFFSREPNKMVDQECSNGKIIRKKICNNLPFFSAFARKIGVDDETLLEWSKKHKEFSGAYRMAKKLQEEFFAVNALEGCYNANFAIFAAKNIIGWKDKVEHSVSDESKGRLIIEHAKPK